MDIKINNSMLQKINNNFKYSLLIDAKELNLYENLTANIGKIHIAKDPIIVLNSLEVFPSIINSQQEFSKMENPLFVFSESADSGKLSIYRPNSYRVKIMKKAYHTDDNMPVLKIDDVVFKLSDFSIEEDSCPQKEGMIFYKDIYLSSDEHIYKILNSNKFKIEWILLEPIVNKDDHPVPQVDFKRINPTKYEVKIKGASRSFWLVFSESFHKQWRIYNKGEVKEARYLFKEPLDDKHRLVNGYANAWYFEPKQLGLGEDFTLVMYFWPQTLFYLGLSISGATFLGCLIYLAYSFFRRKSGKRTKER